jgi:hypothetical protein
VAVSAGGAAAAVWSLQFLSPLAVQAAVRPAAGDWAAPETLAIAATEAETQGPPSVAIDATGGVVAAWPARTGDAGSVRAASRPGGGAWSAPETLAGAYSPLAIAADAAGNAVASWIADGIKVVVRPAGGSWSAPETLPAGTGGFPDSVDVAVAPSGAAVVVWSLLRVTLDRAFYAPAGVEAAVRPAGGAWSAPQRLSETGRLPEAAVDGAGNAIVVWIEGGVRTAARPAGGAWSAPQTLSEAGEETDIAVDGGGRAVAVWSRPFFAVDDSTGAVTRLERVDSATRSPDGIWTLPVATSEPAVTVGTPRVAVNAPGDAVAAWSRGDFAATRVEAALRPADGGWGAAQALSEAGRSAGAADVGIDDSGDAVVVWQRSEGGQFDNRVQATAYDADPRAPGPAKGTPRCLSAPAAPAASTPGRVELSAAQLRINQRIGQAAIRRLNAVEAWLAAGIQGRDICGEAIGAAELASTIVTVLGPAPSDVATPPPVPAPVLPNPRPLTVAPVSSGGDPVRLSVDQLLINQRIYQAAIRRAAALERRFSGRLTGGDLAPGTLAQGQLAARLQVVRATAGTEPAASRTEIAPPGSGGKALSLSANQLRINQRIAQAAVRRANALVAHLRSGLDGTEFADLTITARALAPGVVRP